MIHHENGIISPKDDALQLILCPKVYTSQLLFTNLPCKDTNYKEKKMIETTQANIDKI